MKDIKGKSWWKFAKICLPSSIGTAAYVSLVRSLVPFPVNSPPPFIWSPPSPFVPIGVAAHLQVQYSNGQRSCTCKVPNQMFAQFTWSSYFCFHLKSQQSIVGGNVQSRGIGGRFRGWAEPTLGQFYVAFNLFTIQYWQWTKPNCPSGNLGWFRPLQPFHLKFSINTSNLLYEIHDF